jgi:hypothetical protein
MFLFFDLSQLAYLTRTRGRPLKIKDYPGQHIKLKIDNADLDFAEA